MGTRNALERPIQCFGDPDQPFGCHREAVVAIAAIGATPEGEPLPVFASSCREHRRVLKAFIDGQSVDPDDRDLGTRFYPLEPFVARLESVGYADPDFIDWHAAERMSA